MIARSERITQPVPHCPGESQDTLFSFFIEAKLSRDALKGYLKETLKGVVPEKYKTVEGRIKIVND